MLLERCPYCIAKDEEPGSRLIECNELNKDHKKFCDDKWDDVGEYQ